ncbi:MAG: VWA-like domain-containing protein [Gammaproteobacteria bacterium]|nr:VWA-like domain-containing protein [Gammaproteobacteria bacterium]
MNAGVQSESARRVSACVTELLRKQPFFGSLALRLPLRADPSRKTHASDGREIRYSPSWVAETAAHAIEAAIARAVLACALKHHTRRRDRDPERWQRASQLVTHPLLRDAGFTLPPDAEAWEGLSVEEAYDRLPEPDENGEAGNPAPPAAGVDSSITGPSSGGQPDAEQGNDPSARNTGTDRSDASSDSDSEPGRSPPDASGDAPPSHDPSGTGEVMDSPAAGGCEGPEADLSGSARTAEEQAWDEAMHQAASLAKAEGKLPGAVKETVRGAHVAKLDWRALLRRYMADAAKSDYSWSAPNRRFIDGGLYLPSIRSEGIGTLAVIIDTSGSLPAGTLAEFWTEVREIAADIQPERVVLLQVDTAVRDAAEHSAFDLPEEVVVRGRGGTDFRPGFAWLDERGIRPGACLYFTDMECSRYPDTEPDYPVLWIDWSDPPSDFARAHWGERVAIAA